MPVPSWWFNAGFPLFTPWRCPSVPVSDMWQRCLSALSFWLGWEFDCIQRTPAVPILLRWVEILSPMLISAIQKLVGSWQNSVKSKKGYYSRYFQTLINLLISQMPEIRANNMFFPLQIQFVHGYLCNTTINKTQKTTRNHINMPMRVLIHQEILQL